MVGQQSVEDNMHGSRGGRVWKKREMPLSVGSLAHTLIFLPVYLRPSKSPGVHKSNAITSACVQFRAQLNQCLVRKRFSTLKACYAEHWQKGRQLWSLPTLTAFILSGHEFKKDVPKWHCPTLLEPRGFGNTLQTDENLEALVFKWVPVGQQHRVRRGSLPFLKPLEWVFWILQTSFFFSPSDCSLPPQQSDILFAVEFDRLRWQ